MALIDRSERAFRALLRRMPATIEHNGITKPCVSQTYSVKRAQQLQNYVIDASTQVTMLTANFEALGELKDRVSEVTVSEKMVDGAVTKWGPPLVYLTKDSHVNSAVVHLFLGAVQ